MNQTAKMQHEADYYTKKYNFEKKCLDTLIEAEKNLIYEVAILKTSVAKLKR
jgi:hypothetical protein